MRSINDFLKESKRYEGELVGMEIEDEGEESPVDYPYSPFRYITGLKKRCYFCLRNFSVMWYGTYHINLC